MSAFRGFVHNSQRTRKNSNVHHTTNVYTKCVSTQLEYYSAIKRNELLTGTTKQMNLQRDWLTERSQKQKAAYHMISFIRYSGKGNVIRTKIRLVVARGW